MSEPQKNAPSPAPHPAAPMDEGLREKTIRFAYRNAQYWAIMFGAGEANLALFASYLHMPATYFGYFTGVPQFLGPLAQVVSANWLDHWKKRKAMVMVSVYCQMLAFVPLLFLTQYAPGPGVWVFFLIATALYFLSGHFGAPPWVSLISDVLPPSRRATFFAQQSRAVGLISLIVQLLVGGALYFVGRKYVPPTVSLVYLWAFGLASLARLVTFLYVERMTEPPYHAHPRDSFTFWQFIVRYRESNFVHFVLFSAVFQFGLNLAGPFFLPYMRYDLKLQEWHWVVLSACGTLSSIGTMLLWSRFSDRFGNKRTLTYSCYAVSVIPFLWLLTDRYPLLLLINTFSGMAYAGLGLATLNYILEAASPPKRARCVAYFNIVIGLGILAGSMVGGTLIEGGRLRPFVPDWVYEVCGWFLGAKCPFVLLLLLSGLMRMLACVLLIPTFKELREVPDFSLRNWVVEVTATLNQAGVRLGLLPVVEEEEAPDEADKPDRSEGPPPAPSGQAGAASS